MMEGWVHPTGEFLHILCYVDVDVNFLLLIFCLVNILDLGICIFLICFLRCWRGSVVGKSSEERGLGALTWPLSG
jgi:hypothetical protein